MALGYAEKLSYREDIGKVGMPELFDSQEDVQCKHEGKPLPKADLPFHQARPGITHMALVALQRRGILKFVISQNVDGLHLKSGIPRSCLAELHGSSFREVCSSCEKEYVCDFEVETIGLKDTGRRCLVAGCGGKLKDTVLDWEDALPLKELVPAEKHCKEADVVLCLGTSLQITPACNLPLKAVRGGGKMVIVNLQATPKDKKAALVIHARVDEVIAGMMERLDMSIPPFVRVDRVLITSYFTSKSKNRSANWTLRVSSSHGKKAPLPFIDSVEISFPDRPDLKSAVFKNEPFILRRTTVRLKDFDALVKIQFADGCMCSSVDIHHPLVFGEKEKCVFNGYKEEDVDALKEKAIKDGVVGHVACVETSNEGGGKVYAIVTGIFRYDDVLKPLELKSAKRGTHQHEFAGESTSKRCKPSTPKG